jgi:hypothetical protein
MRILFDHGTPSGLARSLAGHEVTEAIERGWDRISNGELLTTAEAAATPGSYAEVEIPFK